MASASFFVLAGSVAGHELKDPLKAAAVAPGAGAPSEQVVGRAHRLTIDDRVAGMAIDYQTVTMDDGHVVVLRGNAVTPLETGARVAVVGQRNGKALFVESLKTLAAAPRASAKARTAAAEGTVSLLHEDYFDEERSRFVVELEQADGSRKRVDFPVVPEAIRAGARVAVAGAVAADGVSVSPDRVTILSAPTSAAKAELTKAVTTNNVLVILMRFSDSGATPFTQAQVQTIVGGGPGSGSVAEYFKEASFGQQLINPTVTAWLDTKTATPAACNYGQMATIGRNAATAAGYVTSSYQNLVYVFPQVASCGWIGLAYVSGNGVWINGRNQTSAYGHELGHNLGLLHAGSVRCTAGVLGGSCSVAEYGDPFDIMGNQSAMHVNAMQKADLGWIAPSSVISHPPGTRTYTLSPIETAGGATYAVKVPAAANRTYWLEYRQPIGFDAGLVNYPSNGAQIRVATPFETLCYGCDAYSNDTQLLDMTPSTPTFGDAALTVGNAYTDPTYAVSINVLSASASALTLTVTTPGANASVTSTAIASSVNPAPQGAAIALTASVTGASPTGTVTFAEAGTNLAGCSAVPLNGSANAVCNTSSLLSGSHNIVATYSGDAGNRPSTSPAFVQVVNAGALTNGGFETPRTSAYVYAPALAAWTFTGSAGLSANGSGFTVLNPPAPEGTQVAFLQMSGALSQVVALNAGQYSISFKAAQRGNYQVGTQTVVVKVDGVEVGRFQPPGTAYSLYQTPAFSVAASGNHTLSLSGGGSGTEYTAFVDDFRIAPATTTPSSTGIASSLNPAGAGVAVTFTATVSGSAPTGTVAFADGASAISGCNAVALTGSGDVRLAACTTSTLAAGAHNVTASYSGDAANASSASAAVAQTIIAPPSATNVALASNGGVATASSVYSAAYPVAGIINNDRAGRGWGAGTGGWNDGSVNAFPDWVEIAFAGAKLIDRVVVYSVQDNYASPVEPTDTMTFTRYGLRDFTVEAWDGTSWVALGSVSANTLVKRTIAFAAVTTDRIRVRVTNALGSYSRMTEVEAWSPAAAKLARQTGGLPNAERFARRFIPTR